ncbi:MAG: sigma-70 family RNA polymerase sigma factor [Bacteroidales bacterium]|nr:sigma-70 family RNA polymerase sigma factor [Bacteroidales bacterium]
MNNEPKNNDEELSQLIQGCKNNKRAAQHKLFKRFYGSMFAICIRYARDEDEAQDMLNEGFIKIFANVGKYEQAGSFEGWMRRIMVNAAIDYQRRYKTLTEATDFDEINEDEIRITNENEALSKMTADELIKMVQELPTMTKNVFNLFVFEGYAHNEIAQMLNIKEGTSFWHLNNARKLLKDKILKNNI